MGCTVDGSTEEDRLEHLATVGWRRKQMAGFACGKIGHNIWREAAGASGKSYSHISLGDTLHYEKGGTK